MGLDFGIWKKHLNFELSSHWMYTRDNSPKAGSFEKKAKRHTKTLLELDTKIRKFDPKDPVKYDFALFGLGAFEKILNIIIPLSSFFTLDFILLYHSDFLMKILLKNATVLNPQSTHHSTEQNILI